MVPGRICGPTGQNEPYIKARTKNGHRAFWALASLKENWKMRLWSQFHPILRGHIALHIVFRGIHLGPLGEEDSPFSLKNPGIFL